MRFREKRKCLPTMIPYRKGFLQMCTHLVFLSVRTLPHFLSYLSRLAQHEQVQTPAWPKWLKQTPNGFNFIFHIISSLLIWAYLWPGRIQEEERAQVQFSVLAVREILFRLETCLNLPWNWLWENTNEPPPSILKSHSSHYLLLWGSWLAKGLHLTRPLCFPAPKLTSLPFLPSSWTPCCSPKC